MLRAYFSSSDVCYSNVVKTPFELLCIDLIPSIFSNYVSLPFKTDGPIVLETGDVLTYSFRNLSFICCLIDASCFDNASLHLRSLYSFFIYLKFT